VLGASLMAGAQQPPPQTPAKQKQEAKPASAKSAKVWTADDLTSLRSPSDTYVEEKQAQAAEAAAASAAKQQAAAKPAKPVAGPPMLSNPKTPDDADKMIAWENRDITSQQEYVEILKKRLETAPADQKEHLQQVLRERIQIVAATQKERDGLAADKQALEKKAAATNGAAQPPSQ
ncbi:MAG: hypothetical protein ACRD33_01020, partial [Candidatus Acidiferrales bacterium]